MKKIFATIAGLCCFLAAEAQCNFVFVNAAGETLADGASITCNTPNAEYLEFEMLQIGDNGLAVKNTSSAKANCKIKYEVTQLPEDTDYSICLVNCVAYNGSNPSYSAEAKNIAAGATELVNSHMEGELTLPAGSTAIVKMTLIDTTSGEVAGPSLTVNYKYEGSANLAQVSDSDEIESIYSITGQRCDSLMNGINIVRYKSGKCAKVVRK